MTTDFVLDALEQAVYDRRPTEADGLVHHSDRESQYVSIRHSDRLREAGISPSVGSTGSTYDNALVENINGLYKTELIHRRVSWKTKASVELASFEWISWFNHQRLLGSIGDLARRQKPKSDTINNFQIAFAIPGSIQRISS